MSSTNPMMRRCTVSRRSKKGSAFVEGVALVLIFFPDLVLRGVRRLLVWPALLISSRHWQQPNTQRLRLIQHYWAYTVGLLYSCKAEVSIASGPGVPIDRGIPRARGARPKVLLPPGIFAITGKFCSHWASFDNFELVFPSDAR